MRPVVSAIVQSGEPHDYVFHACRLPGSPPSSMTFASREELYFAIARGGGEHVFSHGEDGDIQRDGATITVGSGRCARWTFTWDTRDEAGFPLPAGEYGGSSGVAARFETNPTTSATAYGFNLDVND